MDYGAERGGAIALRFNDACWFFKLKRYKYKQYHNSYDAEALLDAIATLELVV